MLCQHLAHWSEIEREIRNKTKPRLWNNMLRALAIDMKEPNVALKRAKLLKMGVSEEECRQFQ